MVIIYKTSLKIRNLARFFVTNKIKINYKNLYKEIFIAPNWLTKHIL